MAKQRTGTVGATSAADVQSEAPLTCSPTLRAQVQKQELLLEPFATRIAQTTGHLGAVTSWTPVCVMPAMCTCRLRAAR